MTSRFTPQPVATLPKWLSPSAAAKLLQHTKTGNEDFAFALLLREQAGKTRTLSELVRAKLQPREPTPRDWAASDGWPVTALDHRLILARKVPCPPSIDALVSDYDAHVVAHQQSLAMVLTVHYNDLDMFPHDAMAMVTGYCAAHLAKNGLTSIAIQHSPGEMLSECRPHIHIVVFARVRSLHGWGAQHKALSKVFANAWLEEWVKFQNGW